MNKIYADVNEDENVDEPNFQWVVLASEAGGHQELLKRELGIAAEQLCDYEDKISSLNESLVIWKVKACEAAEREAALREELDLLKPTFESTFDAAQRDRTERDALQQRLTVAEQFVQRLIDFTKNQDSITTGYLSDILNVIKGK